MKLFSANQLGKELKRNFWLVGSLKIPLSRRQGSRQRNKTHHLTSRSEYSSTVGMTMSDWCGEEDNVWVDEAVRHYKLTQKRSYRRS